MGARVSGIGISLLLRHFFFVQNTIHQISVIYSKGLYFVF